MRCGSKQRDYIAEFMRDCYTHPTAAEICDRVRSEFPNISLGTVYRNLEYLTARGVLKKLKAADEDRYDYVRSHHNHAVCSVCGRVIDFEFAIDVSALQAAIGDERNFKLCDADFSVVGLCGDCARRQHDNGIDNDGNDGDGSPRL